MRDLSVEGFAVRAMMPIRGGEKTPFTFSLNENVKIEGEGQVLWLEEGGRVAGVQFTAISDRARAQIQEWLVRPETPPSEEPSEGKAAAQNVSLEQLREEMHSVPPRPKSASPVEAPAASVASESDGATMAPAAATPPVTPEAVTATKQEPPTEPMHPPQTPGPSEEPFQEPAAPPLPRLTLPPKVVVPIRPERPTSPPWQEPPASKERWRPASLEMPAEEEEPSEPEHRLPDISAILMQPPGKAPAPAVPMSPVETLASWNEEAAAHQSWTERLSLSNAIAVMAILALLAGLYVFHRQVGQTLIWLGEAMGGVPETQVAATQTQSLTVPQTTAPTTTLANTGATPAENPTTQSVPPEDSPTPPAKLSGNSVGVPGGAVGPNSAVNAEMGQAEYEKAMQILHSGNADVDSPEALRLLWISVEKGNPNAELELAEMYWRGRGVIRNCDQTLILLTAAARKGSGEAQKRLLQYRKEGCE